MSSKGDRWSEEETLFLFKVFMTEHQKDLQTGSPRLDTLSKAMTGRTPSAIHLKLEEIRCNAPGYTDYGRKPRNTSKIVIGIWESLADDYDATMRRIYDAELQGADGKVESKTFLLDEINPGIDVPYESTRREGQQMFRKLVSENYERRCCITGISNSELLVASHIKPWKDSSPEERTNPANGLYLNRLHDGLFDQHLMTLDEDMRIIYSDEVKENNSEEIFESFFGKSENTRIRMPSIYRIDEGLIAYHREKAYKERSYGKT